MAIIPFHVGVSARPEQPGQSAVNWMPYFTTFKIETGNSIVTITSPRPMARQPYLLTTFATSKEQRAANESSFTEYQAAIDQALIALVHDLYNAHPLKAQKESAP